MIFVDVTDTLKAKNKKKVKIIKWKYIDQKLCILPEVTVTMVPFPQ